jgi:hypothetical protein
VEHEEDWLRIFSSRLLLNTRQGVSLDITRLAGKLTSFDAWRAILDEA